MCEARVATAWKKRGHLVLSLLLAESTMDDDVVESED